MPPEPQRRLDELELHDVQTVISVDGVDAGIQRCRVDGREGGASERAVTVLQADRGDGRAVLLLGAEVSVGRPLAHDMSRLAVDAHDRELAVRLDGMDVRLD